MRILSPGLINRGTFTTAPVSSVAGYTRLSTHHLQLQEVRQLDRDDPLPIHQHLHDILLLEELHSIAEHLFRQRLLIEGLCIHKDIIIAIDVQELPALVFNAYVFNFFTRTKTMLDHTPIFQVLQARTHESAPVSWAHMMKLDYRVQFTIETYNHAVVEIGCCRCQK